MKVIILAAGQGTRLGQLGEKIPKCLLPLNGSTLLEQSIQTLKKLNLTDITVIIGYMAEKIQIVCHEVKTVINSEYSTSQPPYSARLGIISNGFLEDDYLIIDGDLIFDSSIIENLINNYVNKSVLVTYTALTPLEAGSRIEEDNNKIKSIGRYISPTFPFQIHAGITRITKNDSKQYIELITSNKFKKMEMHVLLNEFCRNNDLYYYSIDKEKINIKPAHLNLIGGSFSEVITVRDNDIIKKQCTKDPKRLINEIEYLKQLPESLKSYFTELIDSEIGEDFAWYTMKFFPELSFKKLILSGKITTTDSIDFLIYLVNFMKNNVYNINPTATHKNYVNSVHYYRVLVRKDITCERAPIFQKIFNADSIYLNGVEYTNILPLINQMYCCEQLTKKLTPPQLNLIHGDLHFDNILVNPNKHPFNFKLVDPKGFKVGDSMYDISKLIHDFNGLYDFIYEYMFDLKWKIKNNKLYATLNFHNCKAVDEFNKIKDYFIIELTKIFEEDQNWYLRAKFIEAINFCSLQPFHLVNDGIESKSIAMYLIGVKLINYFWDCLPKELKISNNHYKVININTIEDYTITQNLNQNKEIEKFPGI
jgi:choline kinase